jgi:hypothetical protein
VRPCNSAGVEEKRLALDELRNGHRLLLATLGEDEGAQGWLWLIVALLMYPIWFDMSSWSSNNNASDVEGARHCMRRAIALLGAPQPRELDDLGAAPLHAAIRDMFIWIRASDPSLQTVEPLSIDDEIISTFS